MSTLAPESWSLPGERLGGVLEQVGAYSARMTLPAISRFFPGDGLHDFFRRIARLRSQPEDSGRAEYRRVASTTGLMEHFDEASCSPLQCSTSIGYYRECIRLHGREVVAVAENACRCSGATACAYKIQWR